jgi:hypothetical protein
VRALAVSRLMRTNIYFRCMHVLTVEPTMCAVHVRAGIIIVKQVGRRMKRPSDSEDHPCNSTVMQAHTKAKDRPCMVHASTAPAAQSSWPLNSRLPVFGNDQVRLGSCRIVRRHDDTRHVVQVHASRIGCDGAALSPAVPVDQGRNNHHFGTCV